jgi:2,3-bisphosphoglycerate-independent phosphoglycerate mutase
MVTTMDRYQSDWSIVERGWKAHVLGEGRAFPDARTAIETYRAECPGILDQELPPFVIAEGGEPVGPVRDGDAVVTFNFRGDRMLELCAAFEEPDFRSFDRVRTPDVFFCGMTLYDGDTQTPSRYLVSPPAIECTLSELLCAAGVRQLACSETQKYGHVTYFWNGNKSGAFDATLETYIEIPSKPPPFDRAPQMCADAITGAVIAGLDTHRFLRLNYANGDMVGHTGNVEATVAAVEAVDRNLGRLARAVVAERRGALVVTADHGNADDMAERDRSGTILRDASGRMVARTSHSLNPVPFHVVLPPGARDAWALAELPAPGLGNLAATLARLLGFEQPEGFLPSLVAPRAAINRA